MMALDLSTLSFEEDSNLEILSTRPEMIRARRALGCPLSPEQRDLYETIPVSGYRNINVRLRSDMFEEMRTGRIKKKKKKKNDDVKNVKKNYRVNDRVVVRWSKTTKHDASIVHINKGNNTYDVKWTKTGMVSHNVRAEKIVERCRDRDKRLEVMKRSTSLKQAQAVWPLEDYETIFVQQNREDVMVIGPRPATIANSWQGFRPKASLIRCSGFYRDVGAKPPKLFSSVVTLCGDQCSRDSIKYKKFKYWFVLTYIPDLQWSRVVPMVQDGVFESGRYAGRPVYKLLPESPETGCFEIDVSAFRCKKVSSRAVLNVPDADDERWDIGELTSEMKRQTENIYERRFEKRKKRKNRSSRCSEKKKKNDDDDDGGVVVEILNDDDDDSIESVENDKDDDEDYRTDDEEVEEESTTSSSEEVSTSPRRPQRRRRSHGTPSSHSPRSSRRPRRDVDYCEDDSDEFVLSD